MVHRCLHKIYPRVFFKQEVLRVLAELNAIEITRNACVQLLPQQTSLLLSVSPPRRHIYF